MRVKQLVGVDSKHREVGILLDENTILLEGGEWPYDKTPDDVKIFASKELIKNIWQERKIGETLKYDGEITKWRKKCPPRYKARYVWHPMNSLEVSVSNSKSFPDNPYKALEAYSDWRDWVEENNGNITGSMSSTSWSLFRGTIEGESWETPYVGIKGIDHPIGGRLLPCRNIFTHYEGDFLQWDLHAAYCRKLAGLAFGGHGSSWKEVSIKTNFDSLVEKGYCVYIEARVSLGKQSLGPLPVRRPTYHPRPATNLQFPIEGSIDGIWTYEEIRDAISIGSTITIIRALVHFPTGRKYFHRDWYNIIQEGRGNLRGFARGLAKQTGNALWGRYAMRIRPAKTVWRENGKRVWIKHPTRTLKRNQCIELADQLCGKIRSSLYGFAISAGDNLIQGNTDGAWVFNNGIWRPPSDDWRIKKQAVKIDIMDDATYRYWEEGDSEPTYVVPGISSDFTEKYFDRKWEAHFASSEVL